MYFIFGNYGNNTIALIQWAYSTVLTPVTVINVDTQWGAAVWQHRVARGQALAAQYGFRAITLKPSHGFPELITDRKSFPNAKYQWCPTFLKALPFLSWLEEEDSGALATILLGARRQDSRARINLPEFVHESEYYGGRTVWHPMYKMLKEERDQLIQQAGFEVLSHRSLECAPCIHSNLNELQYLESGKLELINQLEVKLNQTWFQSRYPEKSITTLYLDSQSAGDQTNTYDSDMGCGSHYACGE